MAFDAVSNKDRCSTLLQKGFVHMRSLAVGGQITDVEFRATAAEDVSRHSAASSLLNNRYAWRGYGSTHVIPSGAHHTTFTTEVGGKIVGTLTLAIDSDHGLAIDRSFPDHAAKARTRPGAQICELTRFAFDGSVRSKEVLAGLFHMVFIYGTMVSDCSDLFIEVHPRHASFYRAMLGFRLVGEAGVNASVGAPSQLMQLGVDEIGARIAAAAEGNYGSSDHSLYPNFFSTLEEAEIRNAIVLNAIRRHSRPRRSRSNPSEARGSVANLAPRAALPGSNADADEPCLSRSDPLNTSEKRKRKRNPVRRAA